MKKRNWFVDVNEFPPMLNGCQCIVREDCNDNNGENDGLMIIGLNEVNKDISGGLSYSDAQLISAAPDLLEALQQVWNRIPLKEQDVEYGNIKENVRKAIDKALNSTP